MIVPHEAMEKVMVRAESRMFCFSDIRHESDAPLIWIGIKLENKYPLML